MCAIFYKYSYAIAACVRELFWNKILFSNIDCSQFFSFWLALIHFQPMFYFNTPWKYQKTRGFLMFSGGIEVGHWLKMG